MLAEARSAVQEVGGKMRQELDGLSGEVAGVSLPPVVYAASDCKRGGVVEGTAIPVWRLSWDCRVMRVVAKERMGLTCEGNCGGCSLAGTRVKLG